MKETAPTATTPLPAATDVAGPGLRLRETPFRGILASRPLGRLRWLLPPLAAPLELARLAAPPRYFGLGRVPASPWPSLHLAILALAAAGYQVWQLAPRDVGALLLRAGFALEPTDGAVGEINVEIHRQPRARR